mmetsp:Transcript_12703/g.16543  ORF Transcript_12703/g.16543 Transcript_12703/m.16543 type:complete len:358 (+) Transcript_12703:62-1135(+)
MINNCCSNIPMSEDEILNSVLASWTAYEGNELSCLPFNHSLELLEYRTYGSNRCVICFTQSHLYIALRGSESINDWRQNFSLGQISLAEIGFVDTNLEDERKAWSSFHRGFYEKAQNLPLKDMISEFSNSFNSSNIIICGHSQGGAVAQLSLALLLLDINNETEQYSSIRAVGIGSPYFANQSFQQIIEQSNISKNLITISAGTDIVPCILNLRESVPQIFEQAERAERVAEFFLEGLGLVSKENAFYKAAKVGRGLARNSLINATRCGLAPVYVPIGLYNIIKQFEHNGNLKIEMTGWIENSDTVRRNLDQNLSQINFNSITDHFARKYVELISSLLLKPEYKNEKILELHSHTSV